MKTRQELAAAAAANKAAANGKANKAANGKAAIEEKKLTKYAAKAKLAAQIASLAMQGKGNSLEAQKLAKEYKAIVESMRERGAKGSMSIEYILSYSKKVPKTFTPKEGHAYRSIAGQWYEVPEKNSKGERLLWRAYSNAKIRAAAEQPTVNKAENKAARAAATAERKAAPKTIRRPAKAAAAIEVKNEAAEQGSENRAE